MWARGYYLLGTGTRACLMMERLYEDEIEATAASDNVETERVGQRTKKRKMDGAAKYRTKFNPEWIKKCGLAFNQR